MKSLAERKGAWTALSAAILFGISTPLAKGLLAGVSPQILAGLFYLGSGIGLILLGRLLRRSGVREAPLIRVDAPWLVGALLFGGILAPVLLLLGLQRTLASNVSLLTNLESVFTMLLAWLVFHENLDRRFALGIAGIFVGSGFISWQGYLGGDILGPLAVAGACLCWAIDNNLTQRVSGGDPMQVAAVKGLVGGVVNLVLGIWFGSTWPAAAWVATALVVGFFGYGLSLAFFVLALRTLGTARTAAYFSTSPFIGAFVGLIIWRESAAPFFVAGSLAMVVGVWLCITERHEHAHVHEVKYHSHSHAHDEHHQHRHDLEKVSREPHSHLHEHVQLTHRHVHFPDIHHRHQHERKPEADSESS
jgi:drug/metabolite transporter (DMT)-like permease